MTENNIADVAFNENSADAYVLCCGSTTAQPSSRPIKNEDFEIKKEHKTGMTENNIADVAFSENSADAYIISCGSTTAQPSSRPIKNEDFEIKKEHKEGMTVTILTMYRKYIPK